MLYNGIMSEIRRKRQERGLSQEDLAKILGISRQSVFSLEKGIFKPSFTLLAKLENFFSMPWTELFPEMVPSQRISDLNTNFYPSEFEGKEDFMSRSFFEDFDFPSNFQWGGNFWQKLANSPRVNLSEEADYFKLEADLPGFSKDEVTLEVKEDRVTIRAKRELEKQTEKKNYFYHEASASQMERSINLPQQIDSEKAKAEMKEGRLVVWLPKVKLEKDRSKIIKPE